MVVPKGSPLSFMCLPISLPPNPMRSSSEYSLNESRVLSGCQAPTNVMIKCFVSYKMFTIFFPLVNESMTNLNHIHANIHRAELFFPQC